MTGAAFADSLAVVKLYADESGADLVRHLPLLVVSQLARAEVPAALWRKHRIGELSAADTAAGEDVAFVAFDKALCDSAAAEGLEPLPAPSRTPE